MRRRSGFISAGRRLRGSTGGRRSSDAHSVAGVLRVRKERSKATVKIGNEWLARNKWQFVSGPVLEHETTPRGAIERVR